MGTPSLFLSLTEGGRTMAGALVSAFNIPWALPITLNATPDGDGRPVLLLPGFGAKENSLKALEAFLKLKGYSVYDWQQGRNLGPKNVTLDNVSERVREISALHDGAPIDLIGQSLGGTYAAAAVTAHLKGENLVKSVITLGSPMNSNLVENKEDGANMLATFFFDKLNPPDDLDVMQFMNIMHEIEDSDVSDIPLSCLYSHYDGVVSATAAQTTTFSARHENIDISCASHLGMGLSHCVNHIIADRLAQPIDNWAPYSPRKYGPLAELFTSAGKPTDNATKSQQLCLAA